MVLSFAPHLEVLPIEGRGLLAIGEQGCDVYSGPVFAKLGSLIDGQRAEAEVPLDQVTSGWAVGTDPAVHVAAIRELFDSGASIVNVHAGQADQKRVIEFYGREVIPHVNRG